MQVEWRNAEEFTQFAEVLGITPESVMSARSDDGGHFWTVFFTEEPTANPAEWMWHAVIWKGEDGKCEVLSQGRFRKLAQFEAEVKALMERAAS